MAQSLILQEVRVLRRLSQLQNMAMADLVNDTYLKVSQACGFTFLHQSQLYAPNEIKRKQN